MSEETMVSRDQAAKMLGLSISTIEKLIRGEHLASVKIGNRRLIRRSSVLRLRKHGVSAATNPRILNRDYRGRFRKTPLTQVVGSYYKKPPDELQILLAHLRKIDPELGRELKKLTL